MDKQYLIDFETEVKETYEAGNIKAPVHLCGGNEEQLIEILRHNNLENCKYRNLSGGIVAIHSGWKI